MAVTAAAKVTGIDTHTYLVKDPKRALAFYRDILSLPVAWESEQGAEFALSDGSAFGLWKMGDGSWHPGSGVMFAVPDINAAFSHLRQAGVKLLDDEIISTPVCFMFGAVDPEGNTFMMHQRVKKD